MIPFGAPRIPETYNSEWRAIDPGSLAGMFAL